MATGGLGKQSEQMQVTVFGKIDVSSVVICPKCSNGVRATDAPWAKRCQLAAHGALAGVFLAVPATGGLGKQSKQMQRIGFGKIDGSSAVICPKCSNGVRATDAPWGKTL